MEREREGGKERETERERERGRERETERERERSQSIKREVSAVSADHAMRCTYIINFFLRNAKFL